MCVLGGASPRVREPKHLSAPCDVTIIPTACYSEGRGEKRGEGGEAGWGVRAGVAPWGGGQEKDAGQSGVRRDRAQPRRDVQSGPTWTLTVPYVSVPPREP